MYINLEAANALTGCSGLLVLPQCAVYPGAESDKRVIRDKQAIHPEEQTCHVRRCVESDDHMITERGRRFLPEFGNDRKRNQNR